MIGISEKEFDFFAALKETGKLLRSKFEVDWHYKLFGDDWKTTPLQELLICELAAEDELFAKAFDNDVSPIFRQYIDERVKKSDGIPENNSNVNFVIFGEQDCGKSTYAVEIYLIYKSMHKSYHNRDAGFKWTFRDPDTLDAFVVVPKFTMIIQDETDDLKGEGSRNTLNQLGNLVKRGRFSGVSLLKLCPELTEIAGCDYALLPAGFDVQGEEKYLETGDTSDCYSRAILFGRNRVKKNKWRPLGVVIFFVGEAIDFMRSNEYIKLKQKSWEEIKGNRGGAGAKTEGRKKKMEEWAAELFEYAKNHGWNGISKKKLKIYISDLQFAVSDDEATEVIEKTCDMYNRDKGEQEDEAQKKAEELLNKYKSLQNLDWKQIENDIIQEIIKKSKSEFIHRDIEIYLAAKDPLINGDTLAQKHKITPQRINQVLQKITGKIDQKIGEIYEIHYIEVVKKNYYNEKGDTVIHDGAVGKPDLICYKKSTDEYTIISVKCLEFWRNSHSLGYEESRPEIEYAKDLVDSGKSVKVLQHVFNRYSLKIYEEFVEQAIIENQVPFSVYKKKSFIIHL